MGELRKCREGREKVKYFKGAAKNAKGDIKKESKFGAQGTEDS